MKTPVSELFLREPLAPLPNTTKLVWGYIFEHGAGKYPIRALAEKLNLAKETVSKAMRLLEQSELIKFSERRPKSTPTIYALVPDGAVKML